MTTLPIPFVVAFLLVILAASNHHALKATPTGRLFSVVLFVNALGMVLVGVRWSWDLLTILPAVATLSVVSAVLLYLAFLSLGRRGPVIDSRRDWLHIVPVLVVAFSSYAAPYLVELWLIAIKLVYAALLIRLASRYPASVQLVRLHWLKNAQHAMWAAAALQLTSIVVDVAILFDFMLYDGRHAANLVGFVSLMILVLLGYAAILAGRGKGLQQSEPSASTDNPIAAREPDTDTNTDTDTDTDTDKSTSTDANTGNTEASHDGQETDSAQLMQQLNDLLIRDGLYADTELNLQRFARKAGVPPRTLSRTVNTHTGQNLSQWVNSARIKAACTLLETKNITISDAMHASGFVTKSNFNREFRRITGSSPSEWRELKAK